MKAKGVGAGDPQKEEEDRLTNWGDKFGLPFIHLLCQIF